MTTTAKRLYVSSQVQAALMKDILIPEMATGFWKDHRPADHHAQWMEVDIVVSDDEKLGAHNFTVPRLYNFVNPDFIKPNEDRLVACAQAIKGSSNFRSVKKELIELSRIVGGRLTDKNGIPTKANRGTNKPSADAVAKKPKDAPVAKKASTAKKTAVKKGTTTKKGATTVKRMPVTKAAEETATDKEVADAVDMVEAIEQIQEVVSQVTDDPKVIETVVQDTLGISHEDIVAVTGQTDDTPPV